MRRLVFAGVLLLATAAGAAADDNVSHHVARLVDWITAVRAHEPGTADAPLAKIAGWNNAAIKQLWLDAQTLHIFVHCNMCGAPNVVGLDGRRWGTPYGKVDLFTLRRLAATIRDQPGEHDQLLKRAAILHADVVMLIDPAGEPVTSPPPPSQRRFGEPPPAPERMILKTTDGQGRSLTNAAVHWEIAYALLDRVGDDNKRPGAKDDPTVRLWYRATIAHLEVVGMHDQTHYRHALRLFPTDRDILFRAGCLHESLASPPVQVALRTAVVPTGFDVGVKSDRTELEAAEKLYREALAQDPAFAEARLRLGRVLDRLGRHADAAAELRQLSDEDLEEPENQYYAALFLGAAEEALGRRDAAREAYQRASDIFPLAQSARIALSHLARETGDRADALKNIQHVLDLPADPDNRRDPYWVYHFFQGRDVETLLDRLYQPFRHDTAR